jgi:hypothetical protein
MKHPSAPLVIWNWLPRGAACGDAVFSMTGDHCFHPATCVQEKETSCEGHCQGSIHV